MIQKSHLFLKNEQGVALHFNRTRAQDNSKESNDEFEKDYRYQKDNLYNAYAKFEGDRSLRHSRRNRQIKDLIHYDIISIDFLKMVEDTLAHRFEQDYGLAP